MEKICGINLLVCLFFISQLFGQTHHSGYSGQEKREIKSLSQNQVAGYLNAKGMGLAKAAELNHYPGPKHVLELSAELNLSNEQVQKTKGFYNEMHKAASELGKLYIQKEKELDRWFEKESVDEAGLNLLVLEIGKIKSKIRFAHLKAHLQMQGMLSPEQISKYDTLRGYINTNKINHSHNNN